MGERAEPTQWIVARRRQNSGERGEALGQPGTPAGSRRVAARGSAPTRSPGFSRQTRIFRPHPRSLGPGGAVDAAVLMWMRLDGPRDRLVGIAHFGAVARPDL